MNAVRCSVLKYLSTSVLCSFGWVVCISQTYGFDHRTGGTHTDTDLELTWSYAVEVPNSDILSFGTWDASLIATEPQPEQYVFDATARHTSDPYPGDVGGGDPVHFHFEFDGATAFGRIFEGHTTVNHPGAGDVDLYSFIFDRSMNSADSRIVLIGHHAVPEPTSIILACCALAALVTHCRRAR